MSRSTRPLLPGSTTQPPSQLYMPPQGLSRRAFLAGSAALGIAGLSAGLGLSMDQLISATHRSSHDGPLPSAAQLGHLLRRAGFGVSSADFATYMPLGIDGAVDRLLNYPNIPDDVDQRLMALNLDLSRIADLQQWWLLRMACWRKWFSSGIVCLPAAIRRLADQNTSPFFTTRINSSVLMHWIALIPF
jgi:hypothetical protein